MKLSGLFAIGEHLKRLSETGDRSARLQDACGDRPDLRRDPFLDRNQCSTS